ncbi:hypothetical protein LSH36_48g02019 [Paralvinella palmiformis]|uniref:Alpha-carbonic anhydrase domain-containing protein n=1 Tax=Paralvinella palmiformis TaxID=53620 RepID=A0AAD9ND25_9ANNE|nr:hypothetical protein LSH36_48g02019 [Paralvinella palmiformis]
MVYGVFSNPAPNTKVSSTMAGCLSVIKGPEFVCLSRVHTTIQILGYNSDIYGNLTQAIYSANGLIVLGVLAKVGKKPNAEFEIIAQHLKQVSYKGQQVRIRHLSIHSLLPDTNDYMTYEGSLTMPGCFETVTWVIYNSPLIISNEHLMVMRDIWQGDESNPKTPMENNGRPTMDLNGRPIRTNINFKNPPMRGTEADTTGGRMRALPQQTKPPRLRMRRCVCAPPTMTPTRSSASRATRARPAYTVMQPSHATHKHSDRRCWRFGGSISRQSDSPD